MLKVDKNGCVYEYTQEIYTQIINFQNEQTIKAIKEYCEKNDIIPNLINEEILEEVLKLGIAEYQKRYKIEK